MDTQAVVDAVAKDRAIAAFAGLNSSIVSDAMDGLGLPNTVLDAAIIRYSGKSLIARARTVERMPRPANAAQADLGPELGLGTQNVIDSCAPGTAVVIAAQGDCSAAMWGGNMGLRAKARGVLGFVTDGAFRDSDEMDDLGLACFARAVVPRQAVGRLVTVSINQPIVCCSVRIHPDDIIVGDRDGVVVVPAANADAIAAKAHELEVLEQKMADLLREGSTLVDAIAKYKVR